MDRLTYPATLHKLELTGSEIEDLIKSKLRAILDGNDRPLGNAPRKVAQLLTLRTNKGDGNLDQRNRVANSQHLESGTIPNQQTSPQRAASQDGMHVPNQSRAYHCEQEKLFSLLHDHHNGFDDLEVSGDVMKRADGTTVTFKELCNILDEATKTFLNTVMQAGSITSGWRERGKITKIYDSCIEVTAGRIAVFSTFDDNILDVNAYNKWAKHVNMIASFAALAAALKKLVSS